VRALSKYHDYGARWAGAKYHRTTVCARLASDAYLLIVVYSIGQPVDRLALELPESRAKMAGKENDLQYYRTAISVSYLYSSDIKMSTPKPNVPLGGLCTFNVAHGFAEALLRGMRSSFLSDPDYHHLTQCETLDDVRLNLTETDYADVLADSGTLTPNSLQKAAVEKVCCELLSFALRREVAGMSSFWFVEGQVDRVPSPRSLAFNSSLLCASNSNPSNILCSSVVACY